MFDKKPLPVPDLVNADYTKIEERMLADMAKTFSVPEKHLGPQHKGTVTGRLTGSKPNFRELPASRTKD